MPKDEEKAQKDSKQLNTYFFELCLEYDTFISKIKASQAYITRCFWRWRFSYASSEKNA